MKSLFIVENFLLISPDDLTGLILDQVSEIERPCPSRGAVAEALKAIYPDAFVYTGGCHVALHAGGPHSKRDLLVAGNFPDWI